MILSRAQLQDAVRGFAGQLAIDQEYWESASEVRGADLKATMGELGELVVVCDPRDRREAIVLGPDGTIASWWGPKATQLWNANLVRHWPTFYRDLEVLTKPLVNAGVFERLASLLTEALFPVLLTLAQDWRRY